MRGGGAVGGGGGGEGCGGGGGVCARRFAQVDACPDPGGVPVACIDWQAAAGGLDRGGLLACSASEAGVLRIAASLGGGVPVSLRAVLGGLDHVNIALAARAVLHANGTTTATVTVPAPPRFPPGIDVTGAGHGVRRGRGRGAPPAGWGPGPPRPGGGAGGG